MTGRKNDRSRGYFLSAGVEGLFVFDDLIFANLTRTGRCLKEITCKEVKFCVSEKKKKNRNKTRGKRRRYIYAFAHLQSKIKTPKDRVSFKIFSINSMTCFFLILQASFLTFRPLPYVTVSFQAPANDSFDAGDRVEYELILNNIDSTISAYSLSVIVSFETVDTNSLNTSCSGGTPKFNATTKQSRLFITPLAPSQSIRCKYESRLQARISPKQLISQMVTVEYYNKNVGNNPQNAASYNEKRRANITTKPIDTSILSSKNADKLEAGDPVNFTVQLQLPECETNLSVVVDLPTVPESVIDLARKRRSLQGIGIESEEDNLRLVVSFLLLSFWLLFQHFFFS